MYSFNHKIVVNIFHCLLLGLKKNKFTHFLVSVPQNKFNLSVKEIYIFAFCSL